MTGCRPLVSSLRCWQVDMASLLASRHQASWTSWTRVSSDMKGNDRPCDNSDMKGIVRTIVMLLQLVATRQSHFLQAARSSGSLPISFELSRVHSFTSSKHCLADLPRDLFLSALLSKTVFPRAPFTLTTWPKPNGRMRFSRSLLSVHDSHAYKNIKISIERSGTSLFLVFRSLLQQIISVLITVLLLSEFLLPFVVLWTLLRLNMDTYIPRLVQVLALTIELHLQFSSSTHCHHFGLI